MPHISGILGAVEKLFTCVRPAAPSFRLMSLALPFYLAGKTYSQVIFHLTFRQTSYAQLLPCKGHFVSPIAATFLLCTASAAEKCSGDRSTKTARTAWDVSAAQICTSREECFFNHPASGINTTLAQPLLLPNLLKELAPLFF